MQDNKRQNLSVNERKIVELTLQGESQKGIANKLNIAPSTVYRTLRREHIQDMITSATQGLMSSLVQKMLQKVNFRNYKKQKKAKLFFILNTVTLMRCLIDRLKTPYASLIFQKK